MLKQLDPLNRQNQTTETIPSQYYCISNGMDQGFHNWLIHSGELRKYMKVKIFHQVFINYLFYF